MQQQAGRHAVRRNRDQSRDRPVAGAGAGNSSSQLLANVFFFCLFASSVLETARVAASLDHSEETK